MKLDYRRDIHTRFMIITPDKDDAETSYRLKMLTSNAIPGVVRCTCEYMNGMPALYYDISVLQPLSFVFAENRADTLFFMNLINALLSMFQILGDYLLDAEDLLLTKDTVFLDMKTKEIRFTCFPFGERNVDAQMKELAAFLLSKAAEEAETIKTAYRFYAACTETCLTAEALMGILRQISVQQTGGHLISVQQIGREQTYGQQTCGQQTGRQQTCGQQTGRQQTCGHQTDRQRTGGTGAEDGYGPGGFAGIDDDNNEDYYNEDCCRSDAFSEKENDSGKPNQANEPAFMYENGNKKHRFTNFFRKQEKKFGKAGKSGKAGMSEKVGQTEKRRKSDKYGKAGKNEKSGELGNSRKMAGWEEYRRPVEDVHVPAESKWDQDVFTDIGETVVLSNCKQTESGGTSAWLVPVDIFFGETIELIMDSYVIGRGRGDDILDIGAKAVSRRHAAFRKRAGSYEVSDLGSRNGTFVNGMRLVSGECRTLNDGDTVRFADAEYHFCINKQGL